MISHTANSAKPFSYCFSKQKSPVILITLDVFFFHAQTLQFSYHKTMKVQSYVTAPVSSNLPSTLLAYMHLPSVKTKVPRAGQRKNMGHIGATAFTIKNSLSQEYTARLCFSLEFPLCVDVKRILVHSLKSCL